MKPGVPLLVAQLILGACTPPARHIEATAESHGFSRSIVRGTRYEHVLYSNRLADANSPLHVYIEGDGIPYLAGGLPAPDPTPRVTVMLDLMALDPGPAVYLGRPCYFGLADRPPCEAGDWTQRRFSPEVVESMASALDQITRASHNGQLELFGHSGGGTLAVLLAHRVKNVIRVVTLAGNLDHRKWSELHGYLPLTGSLNPVDEGPLPAYIAQLHVAGERDKIVPANLIESAAIQLGAEGIRILPGQAHACCWADFWQELLARPSRQ